MLMQQPSDAQVQALPKENEEGSPGRLSRWPDNLAFLLYGLGLAALGFFAFPSKNVDLFLDYGMGLTCIYFGFKGYRHGFFHELTVIFRFVVAVFLGYQTRNDMGNLLGLPGLLGGIAGFYLVFFVIYVFLGFAVKLLMDESRRPAILFRLIGLFLGVFEGIALFSLVGVLLTFFSTQMAGAGGFTSMLSNRLSSNFLEPFLERNASGPMVLLTLAHEAKNGFDPKKMDTDIINQQFGAIRNNPKIRTIAEDQEIAQMAKDKNFQGIIKHPKVIALLSDGDIQKAFTGMDWSAIAFAVRKGIHPNPAQTLPGINSAP